MSCQSHGTPQDDRTEPEGNTCHKTPFIHYTQVTRTDKLSHTTWEIPPTGHSGYTSYSVLGKRWDGYTVIGGGRWVDSDVGCVTGAMGWWVDYWDYGWMVMGWCITEDTDVGCIIRAMG